MLRPTERTFITTFTLAVMAMTSADAMGADAAARFPVAAADTAVSVTDTAAEHRPGVVKRVVGSVIDYFARANVPRTDGRLDVSFIGGPHFDSDTKFGIGLIAAARYGFPIYLADSVREIKSEADIKLDVTTTGFLSFGVSGVHIHGRDDFRINYMAEVSNFPSKFWGIGFEAAKHHRRFTKFNQVSFKARASVEWQVIQNLYTGPLVNYDLISAKRIADESFWDGQKTSTSYLGVGGAVAYDTRDNITAPRRGWQARVEVTFYPSGLGRPKKSFTTLDFSVNHYRRVWRGGVLAMRLHASMCTGSAPWSMLATFGGSTSMRGYYLGQYRDKDEVDLTLELRQHVWRRSGVVVWVGAATVFPKFSTLRWNRVLPDAGFGYRWEFKKNTNVRVDLGFGRSQKAFIFSINEAF